MATTSKNFTILHVIDSLDSSGGAEQQLLLNLRHFGDERLSHELVVLHEAQASRKDEIPAHVPWETLFRKSESPTRVTTPRRLRALMKRRMPDLVHATLPASAMAARIAGLLSSVPVVESLVNISHEAVRVVDNPNVSMSKLKIHRIVDSVTMRNTTAFHAISDAVADSWIRTVNLPMSKVNVIPRSLVINDLRVDPAERTRIRSSVLKEFGLPHESLLVVAVGRVEPQKGHRYLVEAASYLVKAIPNIRILMVGRPGLTSDEVARLIEALGLNQHVEVVGPRRDISRLLAAADIFAFPSLFEGLGVALLEAMAAGVPVVTSNKPPMSDLVTDCESGLLVPTRDPHALAQAIQMIANNSDLRERMTQAAFERIKELPTPSTVARQFEEWYLDLLDQR